MPILRILVVSPSQFWQSQHDVLGRSEAGSAFHFEMALRVQVGPISVYREGKLCQALPHLASKMWQLAIGDILEAAASPPSRGPAAPQTAPTAALAGGLSQGRRSMAASGASSS